MAFTLPDAAAALYAPQAYIGQMDLDIVLAGYYKTGVTTPTDCVATPQGGNMVISISTGYQVLAGTVTQVGSAQTVTATADGTNPRFALVYLNSSGVASITHGTAAAAPVKPALPANATALAEVYIPAGTTAITTGMIVDKRVVLNNPATIEAITRVMAIGHSHIAETGASALPYGSMHKFANLFPARFTNLSQGGAVAVLPGLQSPDQVTSVGTVLAGWGNTFSEITNRERTTGINTTLTANTSAGLAAQTSVAVAASAGAAIATQPVMVGKGATAEIAYVFSIPDSTHVSFYSALANAHSSGDPVVAVPDAYLMARQVVVLEYDINDMIWMGPTAWNQAFIQCYRSIIARLRCCAHWDADSTLIATGGSGTWSITTPAAGYASGPKLISNSTAGGTLTLSVPPNFPANSQLVLFFRTRAAGDGALWTIQIDGDSSHTVTHDSRSINGFGPYNSGAATRAANGVEMSSCYVIRGLAAGAHTILLTITSITGTADFMGFGVIPPDLPPLIVERPLRWMSYAGLPGTMYTPTDSDVATMDSAIVSLLAEFTAPTSTVFGGTAAADPALLNVNKDALFNKQAKFFSYDGVHPNDLGHAELGNLLAQTVNNAQLTLRSLIMPTVNPSTKSGAGWYPFGSAGSGAPYRLQAGWANYSGGLGAAYRYDVPSGRIELRGEIQRTTDDFTVVSPLIAILPLGHRPISELHFNCFGYTGTIEVVVEPTGNIYVAGIISNANDGNSYLSLDGISFIGEQ